VDVENGGPPASGGARVLNLEQRIRILPKSEKDLDRKVFLDRFESDPSRSGAS
jgi:hypothetical protein